MTLSLNFQAKYLKYAISHKQRSDCHGMKMNRIDQVLGFKCSHDNKGIILVGSGSRSVNIFLILYLIIKKIWWLTLWYRSWKPFKTTYISVMFLSGNNKTVITVSKTTWIVDIKIKSICLVYHSGIIIHITRISFDYISYQSWDSFYLQRLCKPALKLVHG